MTLRVRVVVLILAAACLLFIVMQVRRRRMRASYLVLWTSLCLTTIPLVAAPGAVDRVAGWLGIYYGPATLFLAAIVVLFLISIHFSREITRLEERTRTLAEELALARLEASEHRRRSGALSAGGDEAPERTELEAPAALAAVGRRTPRA
jgi:hypothetical protein